MCNKRKKPFPLTKNASKNTLLFIQKNNAKMFGIYKNKES